MPKVVAVEDFLSKRSKVRPIEDYLRGPSGLPGVDGKDGLSGRDGRDGKDGKDGQKGRDGSPGRDGKDGVGINWRGYWKPEEQYYVNDAVNYQGGSYIAIKDNRRDFPNRVNNGWDLLAGAGAPGANGRDGGGVSTQRINVNTTEYTVSSTELIDGYNIFVVDAGGNTTITLPNSVADTQFIVIKNRMDSFTVTVVT